MDWDVPPASSHFVTYVSSLRHSIILALLVAACAESASENAAENATANAAAKTYFVSPTGSNTNSGVDVNTPWKTFDFAVASLRPGDVLTLLDGTYNSTTTGVLSLNGVQGTPSAPITIKAFNERKAWISGNGSEVGVRITNSSYVVVEGLRVSSADLAASSNIANVRCDNCSNVTFRRLLVHHNNRYWNSPLVQIDNGWNNLFEELELYYYHRHGLILTLSNNNVVRRVYCNSRDYPDIAGGFVSGARGGDSCIAIYPGDNNIVENVISEGSSAAFDIQAQGSAINNHFLGDVAIGGNIGFLFKARGSTAAFQPQNTTVSNGVVITPNAPAFYGRGNINTRCINCTFYQSSTNSGLVMDVEGDFPGEGTYSGSSENLLTILHVNGSGINMTTEYTWIHDHANSFGNGINYNPAASPNYIASTSIDPRLNTCRIWIPDTSPMKRVGKGGADIGANILYRYENGALTKVPLWDPTTGEFPHGVIVSGLNDVAGQSVFDVHKRLNVNTNGCAFPEGYG